MRNTRRIYPVVFLAMFAVALALIPQTMFAAAVGSRITQAIDEARTLRLAGNTRPEANAQNDRGPVSDVFDVDHIFLLLQRSAEKEQELNTLIDELNDRNSPNFHHWLTAEELGDRFGVAQEDIDTVTSWLEAHGFRINNIYPNKMLIDFSGTAGQLRAAFGTSIHQLEVNGEQHIANMSDPQIPMALAPVVKGIASLNDFKPHPMYKVATPDYTFAGCAATADFPTEPGTCYAMTPQDDQTIYNLNPLYTSGYSGQGQTIVLVEDTDTYGGAADWNSYRTAFGLTAYAGTYTQAHPGGCTDPGTNADDGEAAIDVEMATAIAPSASIELISCAGGSTTFGGLIALTNLVNAAGPYPGIVSVSYGVCEAFNGNGGNQAFYNTYQQAAAEGISVFVSSGDDGPSSCSADFNTPGYQVASLGITGWGETPFNVSVGGTDFEDVYNSKTGQNGGAPLSTYWSATNTSGDGSALSYIPEMPWNDSCANLEISEIARSSFTTYGSTGTCNVSPWDTTASYLSTGAASGGVSNCATGQGGTDQGADGMSDPQCQGYAKPSWQSGASLKGGKAVYGQPSDGLRDIPDVSMFAANGNWGHFETVCWSDPSQTSGGAVSCSGAPSTWSGFGGTSVATPTMAAIQALVNQKTGETWGNPNPIYYQMAQNEYGTAGGTFQGSGCNSSTGSGAGCVFNDVTQGDIDLACEYNGTLEEAHCYKPSGTFGVTSTDNVTAAAVINGGSGYTTAPTCTIAGPSNNSPYKTPTGTTVWAGGTQATCTASVTAASTTAKWTVAMQSTTGDGDTIILTNVPLGGSTTCGPYTISGASTTAMASGLVTSIGSGCSLASATSSTKTATITAKTAGAAGNFITEFGPATEFDAFYVYITNTTLGQGPNYVSSIAITTAGSGYQPETPITLGGPGSGAIAVANTSFSTGAQSYQPAYGAAPGYDLATGLGTPNAANLVNNCVWTGTCQQSQTITFTTNAPVSAAYNSSFGVAATASSGLTVAFTAAGSCSVVDNLNGSATYTMTSGTGTCSVIANQAGNASYTAAPTVTETTSATKASQTVTFTTPPPASAVYGSQFSVLATGGGSGNPITYGSSGGCSNVNTLYTMISGTVSCTVTASQAGNGNYSSGQASASTSAIPAVLTVSANNASMNYGDAAFPTFSANITGYVNGDGSGVVSGSPAFNTNATLSSVPGSYTIFVTQGTLAAANYTFTFVNGFLTINMASSTTTIGANPTTIGTGDSTTLTATVTGSTNGVAPTGTVTFYNGATVLGTGCLGGCGPVGEGKERHDRRRILTAALQARLKKGKLGPLAPLASSATLVVPASALQFGDNPDITVTYAGDSNYNGGASSAADVMVVNPGIYSPTPGSTLTGYSATFSWYGAAGATAYWIDIGNVPGGNQYYQSGSLPTTTESVTVNSLPLDGSTVYVTLYWLIGGSWVANPYTYTAFGGSGQGQITSPTPGSTLTGSTVTFTWTAGQSATAYWLDAGSSAGGNQYYQSGNLGNVLTTTASGLPSNGSTVYVTLYSYVSGVWLSTGYTYTAYNLAAAGGVITTPTPGSMLNGSSVTFDWTAGAGATNYWLDVGSTPNGNQYEQSGPLGNVLTTTVSGLPTDGSTIYVTLYTYVSGVWSANSYTYTAFNATGGIAAMQTPVPGSILSGYQATFTWSSDNNASAYWMDIGSTVGGNDIYQSGNLGLALTTTVYSLPADGSTIYVTLYSYVGGQWLSNSYTYTSGP